jgi:hypothetical protein
MTTARNAPPVAAERDRAESAPLRRAWFAVLLIPVAFVLAFAVGEGIYAWLGDQPEAATEPLWVVLVAGVPAIVLFLLPCAAASWYGNRARQEGHRVGWVPLVIGAVLGVWMMILNVVSLMAG